jgi:hypothetical protein
VDRVRSPVGRDDNTYGERVHSIPQVRGTVSQPREDSPLKLETEPSRRHSPLGLRPPRGTASGCEPGIAAWKVEPSNFSHSTTSRRSGIPHRAALARARAAGKNASLPVGVSEVEKPVFHLPPDSPPQFATPDALSTNRASGLESARRCLRRRWISASSIRTRPRWVIEVAWMR